MSFEWFILRKNECEYALLTMTEKWNYVGSTLLFNRNGYFRDESLKNMPALPGIKPVTLACEESALTIESPTTPKSWQSFSDYSMDQISECIEKSKHRKIIEKKIQITQERSCSHVVWRRKKKKKKKACIKKTTNKT